MPTSTIALDQDKYRQEEEEKDECVQLFPYNSRRREWRRSPKCWRPPRRERTGRKGRRAKLAATKNIRDRLAISSYRVHPAWKSVLQIRNDLFRIQFEFFPHVFWAQDKSPLSILGNFVYIIDTLYSIGYSPVIWCFSDLNCENLVWWKTLPLGF